jgi:hypothetical protein
MTKAFDSCDATKWVLGSESSRGILLLESSCEAPSLGDIILPLSTCNSWPVLRLHGFTASNSGHSPLRGRFSRLRRAPQELYEVRFRITSPSQKFNEDLLVADKTLGPWRISQLKSIAFRFASYDEQKCFNDRSKGPKHLAFVSMEVTMGEQTRRVDPDGGDFRGDRPSSEKPARFRVMGA